MVGGMGHSSALALGFSLNKKNPIICLDGDGSVLMHMGSLRSCGLMARKNFKHILLNNNSHESVGGQSTFAFGINFKKVVLALGYKKYFIIKSINNFDNVLKSFLKSTGPSFLEVKITEGSLKNLSRPRNLKEIKKLFMS